MRTLIWKGTAYEALLKNSKDVEEYQAVWKMVERCNGTYETNSLYSMNHLRSVLSGEAVIVSDVTTMRYHVSRTCHLFRDANYYFAKEQFFPHKFAIALRNGTDSRFTEFMNKRPEPERIDSMKALSAHPNMRTLIWKGTAYEALLKNSKDVEEYQAVWKMVERCNGTYETNSLYSMNHLRSVLSGEAVIVSDVTTMRYHVSRTCHLFRDANYYFAKEQFFPHKFAIALRNGTDSRFTEFMNKRINWVVESGLLQAWMNREYGDWAACSAANHDEVYTPLSIFEVQSIFLVYLMFTAISVAAFLLEVASKVDSRAMTDGRVFPACSPTQVPTEALQALTALVTLNLSYNRIQAVQAWAFRGLVSLLRLSLFGNRIVSLDPMAFQGVGGNLTRLNLGGNVLSQVPSESLQSISVLQQLLLHENRISELSPDRFPLVGSALDILNLADNRIVELPEGAFSGLGTLVSLDLERNGLAFIHPAAFVGVHTTMEWLKLGHNSLSAVPSEALQNLTALRELDLRDNNISYVHGDAFDGYGASLKFVYLQKNR
ncbi:uncharacterized protein ISCGN_008014 [Ixodes scapularis]